MTMTVPLCNNSLLHPRCCRSSPIHYCGRRACHPKRGNNGGCKQHYSCWQWNCWNRWGGVSSAPGLVERIHWHHLSQWSWRRTFCRERWWTRWRGFDHHGRWPTAKEAEEDSEPRVSLLLRSDLVHFQVFRIQFQNNFRYLVSHILRFWGVLVSWGQNSGYISIPLPPLAGPDLCIKI